MSEDTSEDAASCVAELALGARTEKITSMLTEQMIWISEDQARWTDEKIAGRDTELDQGRS